MAGESSEKANAAKASVDGMAESITKIEEGAFGLVAEKDASKTSRDSM